VEAELRSQEKWQEFKRRLQARGKPGAVIAAAVVNRWVRQLRWKIQPPNIIVAA
jgi:hypothetical protein